MKAIYYVVGARYRGAEALVASLAAGEEVLLKREPTNQYDRNAVQVWARETHVGYLPAPQAARLAPRMDATAGGADYALKGRFAVTADRRPAIEVEED